MLSGLFALSMLGLAAAAPTSDEAALFRRQYPSLPCSHTTGGIHVLAVGGANSNDPKVYGLIGSLAKKILTAIPGSTNVSVPYDKRFATTSPTVTLEPGAIQNGMTTLKQYVMNYHYSCPKTKMAIIAYSSGAVITMNDYCYGGDGNKSPQMNPLLAPNTIIGTILYGDETRVGGQSYDVGTCPSQYSGNAASKRDVSKCAGFVNNMQSYCDAQDPDCCAGSGNDVSVHLSYPSKYDDDATAFIVKQFQRTGA